MLVEQVDPQPTGQRLLSYLPALLSPRRVGQEQVPRDKVQLCPYSLKSHEARGCLPVLLFICLLWPRCPQGAGSGRVLNYLPGESSSSGAWMLNVPA